MRTAYPRTIVTCDECSAETTIVLLPLAEEGTWSEENVDADLTREGWGLVDGHDVCPACIKESLLAGIQSASG